MRDICFISPIFGRYFDGNGDAQLRFCHTFPKPSQAPLRVILTKRSAPDAALLDSQIAQATRNITHPILTGRFGEDARAIIRHCNFPDTILYLNSPT